jgi:hypothetical protein
MFYEQSISGSIRFVSANRSKALTIYIKLAYISTSVNTTWRTACLTQDFMECAGNTPTFLTRGQYYADSE